MFVKQKRRDYISGKEKRVKGGGRGVLLGAARRAQSSGSAPRDHCGCQLSPCRWIPYRSYFFLLAFGVQVSHTLDIPDCRINQMVNMFL